MKNLLIFLLFCFQSTFSQNAEMKIKPISDTIRFKNLFTADLFTILITNNDTINYYGKQSIGYKENFPKSRTYFKTEFRSLENKPDSLFHEYNDYHQSTSFIEDGEDDSKYYTEKLAPKKIETIKCNPFKLNGLRGLGKYKVTFYVTYLIGPMEYFVLNETIEFEVRE